MCHTLRQLVIQCCKKKRISVIIFSLFQVLQQQLAHLYFLVWFERLQNVKPADLELNMLASQGKRISDTVGVSFH